MATRLISRSLTPTVTLSAIRSLIRVGSLSTPCLFSALPTVIIGEASPKAISGRTSYIRVRLEFLRYPQVIRQRFNGGRFGPPLPFTATSTCSWIGHPVSGLLHATSRTFHPRFPFGFVPSVLNLAAYNNSPDRSTKSTTSHFNVLCVLVNIRFQVLFHSPPGVLFTVPSQYLFSIGHQVVFRLRGWSPHVPIGFHVSDRTLDTVRCLCVSSTCLSHSLDGFPTPFDYASSMLFTVLTPTILLPSVWPLSLSLAATHKISFDFSSYGYLDVSLPRVPFVILFYSYHDLKFFT